MFGELLQYDFINKSVTESDIEIVKKIVKVESMELTYFGKLQKNESKFVRKEQFEDERFYCLSLNRSINDLQISFMNVFYYRKMSKSIDVKNRIYRLKDLACYEELYFYYFFFTIDNIFKIVDKSAILLNECLNLGLDKNKKDLNVLIIKKMELLRNKNTSEINDYLKYMSNYKKTTLCRMKNKYRNKNTHNFTSEIPKYRIKNNQILFDESLKIENTYNDLLVLFDELRKFLKLVDEVVLYSIKKQGCD